MPSASTTAPVRSAWALTAFMISAIAGPGPLLHQPQVELDDVGRAAAGGTPATSSRRPRRRRRLPQPSARTRSTVRSSSAGPGGQRALGDLEDQPQLAAARRRRWRAGRPAARCPAPRARRSRRRSAAPAGPARRRRGTRRRGRSRPARRAGRPRARRRRAGRAAASGPSRAAGQRLVGHDPSGVELDDRLEHAVHAPGAQRCLERAAVGVLEVHHVSAIGRAGPVRKPDRPRSPQRGARQPGSVIRTTAVTRGAQPGDLRADQPLAQHRLRQHHRADRVERGEDAGDRQLARPAGWRAGRGRSRSCRPPRTRGRGAAPPGRPAATAARPARRRRPAATDASRAATSGVSPASADVRSSSTKKNPNAVPATSGAVRLAGRAARS